MNKKKKEKNEIKYIVPKRKPTEKEERKMIGKSIELMIVEGMTNHIYQFQNVIRKQSIGGPIGLALTGEIGDCCILDWDRKFVNKMREINLLPDLYSRFKDDMLVVTKTVEKGSIYVDGRLEINEKQKETDADRDETDITMDIVKEIGESIDPTIKLTVDATKNYNDGKMPVLDITVNVNEKERNRIDFEFFEKKTKNPRVILANSAINLKSKRTILTQECLRRIRNTKRELGEEIRNKHLNKFMLILKQCGYVSKFRKEVLNSALSAFEKMEEDDKNGTKPMHRSAQWEKKERMERKNYKKLNWWKNAKSRVEYKSLLFVPPHLEENS